MTELTDDQLKSEVIAILKGERGNSFTRSLQAEAVKLVRKQRKMDLKQAMEFVAATR